MKLEKREITLNEQDSLLDAISIEKNLLLAYVQALENVRRREVREQLLTLLKEVAEEMFLFHDKKIAMQEDA